MQPERCYVVKMFYPPSKPEERRGRIDELLFGYAVRSRTKGFEVDKTRADCLTLEEAWDAIKVLTESLPNETSDPPAFTVGPSSYFPPELTKRKLSGRPRQD